MFGYILPMAGELKVKEYEKFKSAYCGLCHAMGRRCGLKARFLLNYDFTFLAMLLDHEPCQEEDRMCRCVASPFRKKRVCMATDGFEIAADTSVILSYWKLKDTVQDEGVLKSIGAGLLSLLLLPSYRKAAKRRKAFDAAVSECLSELRKLEEEKSASLDQTADTFARLLQAAGAEAVLDQKRPVEQILYHVGRWIYLADAYDDLEEDFRRKRYNPLIYRFSLTTPQLPEESRKNLGITMQHSLNLAVSAYGLFPQGRWSEIIGNILYLGLPASGMRVQTGEKIKWKKANNRRKNI